MNESYVFRVATGKNLLLLRFQIFVDLEIGRLAKNMSLNSYTYLRVKEKTVHAPWERLYASVQVVIVWNLGKFAVILGPQVFQMLLVGFLGLIDPKTPDENLDKKLE